MSMKFYGNEVARQILTHSIQDKRLGHAYLIYGENGLGKKTFAEYFVKSVLCKGEPKPCLACSVCHKVENRIHPDVIWHLGSEARNSIHIDTVREIRGNSVIKPNEAAVKTYILTNVQNMTTAAFNAFLKTLEEPPKNTLFLLTAPAVDMLPETILSRLLSIQLFPLTDAEMEAALCERFPELDASERKAAVSASAGNLGKAIQRISDQDYAAMQDSLTRLCGAVKAKQEYRILQALTLYEKDKEHMKQLLERMILTLREGLFCKLETAFLAENQLADALSKDLSKRQMIALIEFLEASKLKLDTNAHGGLLVAYICAGMKEIIDHEK